MYSNIYPMCSHNSVGILRVHNTRSHLYKIKAFTSASYYSQYFVNGRFSLCPPATWIGQYLHSFFYFHLTCGNCLYMMTALFTQRNGTHKIAHQHFVLSVYQNGGHITQWLYFFGQGKVKIKFQRNIILGPGTWLLDRGQQCCHPPSWPGPRLVLGRAIISCPKNYQAMSWAIFTGNEFITCYTMLSCREVKYFFGGGRGMSADKHRYIEYFWHFPSKLLCPGFYAFDHIVYCRQTTSLT